MPTQLSLYNGALLALGERKLLNLSENREPRRVLDAFWDDEAVRYLLSRGLWNFAKRSVRIEYDPDYESEFGFRYAFTKPDDWVRTMALCTDEYFQSTLLRYSDEAGFWYADVDTIYVQFVSDDEDYGSDLSLWPENFTQYAEHWLALKACKRIANSTTDKEQLKADVRRLLTEAKSSDAMDEPTSFPPSGSWARARSSGWSRRDRIGSRLTE
jgi:hypothetical protein